MSQIYWWCQRYIQDVTYTLMTSMKHCWFKTIHLWCHRRHRCIDCVTDILLRPYICHKYIYDKSKRWYDTSMMSQIHWVCHRYIDDVTDTLMMPQIHLWCHRYICDVTDTSVMSQIEWCKNYINDVTDTGIMSQIQRLCQRYRVNVTDTGILSQIQG